RTRGSCLLFDGREHPKRDRWQSSGGPQPSFTLAAQSRQAAPESSGIELRRAPVSDCIVSDAVCPFHSHHLPSPQLFLLDQRPLDHVAGNYLGPADASDGECSPVSNGALQVLAMLTDFSPLLITIFAFGAVAIAVFVIGQLLAVQFRLRKRIAISR